MDLTPAAKTLLHNRYLLEKETPDDLFRRVAHAVDTPLSEDFLHVMKELLFIPNSPTLMNAGTSTGQLQPVLYCRLKIPCRVFSLLLLPWP